MKLHVWWENVTDKKVASSNTVHSRTHTHSENTIDGDQRLTGWLSTCQGKPSVFWVEATCCSKRSNVLHSFRWALYYNRRSGSKAHGLDSIIVHVTLLIFTFWFVPDFSLTQTKIFLTAGHINSPHRFPYLIHRRAFLSNLSMNRRHRPPTTIQHPQPSQCPPKNNGTTNVAYWCCHLVRVTTPTDDSATRVRLVHVTNRNEAGRFGHRPPREKSLFLL